jgi:hypothetical protein
LPRWAPNKRKVRVARPPRAHSLISSAHPPRSSFATRNCLFQTHCARLTPEIGFVSHACPQQGPRWQSWRPMPHPVGAGQIGFVWRNGSGRRLRRRLRRPAPISVRVGKLASFGTPGPTGGTGSLAGPCPPRSGRKLALFCCGPLARHICHNSFTAKRLPAFSLCRELALFRAFWPNGAGRGKLGSFGAIDPSDGSVGDFAGPRPSRSIPANWLRLYQRSQRRFHRRPRPSASTSIARDELASFRTHWFGVPRLRGSDRSFPPKGGTPNGPRSQCLWGRSSTRMHTGPLTTKPSQVVVSHLPFAILLLCYHTVAPIPRQAKSTSNLPIAREVARGGGFPGQRQQGKPESEPVCWKPIRR